MVARFDYKDDVYAKASVGPTTDEQSAEGEICLPDNEPCKELEIKIPVAEN